jgi:uncharacterized membrane protein
MTPRLELFRTVLRYLLAAVYFFVGVVHLRSPDVFLPIVPEWVPFARETVLVTGACEIAGAVALLTTRLRYAAGVMLALYAVCVFPANVKHALEGVELGEVAVEVVFEEDVVDALALVEFVEVLLF